jgi:hypothetical protein
MDKFKQDLDAALDRYVLWQTFVCTLRRSIPTWNFSWHYEGMKEEALQQGLSVPDEAGFL